MKLLTAAASICLLTVLLTACGSDEKTTVIHERPVVVAPAGTSIDSVERNCPNGYDNRTRSCY